MPLNPNIPLMFQYKGVQDDGRSLADIYRQSQALQAARQQEGIAANQETRTAALHPAVLAQEQANAARLAQGNKEAERDFNADAGFRSSVQPTMSPQDILMAGMRAGKVTPSQYVDGTQPKGPTPAEIAKEAWEKDYKERQLAAQLSDKTKDNALAAAKFDLTKEKTEAEMARKAVDVAEVTAQADEAVSLIDQMIGSDDGAVKRHPGFGGFVGAKGISSLFGLFDKPINGTDAAGFSALYDQVKGGAFMEAVQKMKGTGALSDTEGKAAAGAITRMQAAQSESEFIKSAKEFRTAIKNRKGRVIAKQAAGAPNLSAPVAPQSITLPNEEAEYQAWKKAQGH